MWNTEKLIPGGSVAIRLWTKESRQVMVEVEVVAEGFAGSRSVGSTWAEGKPA